VLVLWRGEQKSVRREEVEESPGIDMVGAREGRKRRKEDGAARLLEDDDTVCGEASSAGEGGGDMCCSNMSKKQNYCFLGKTYLGTFGIYRSTVLLDLIAFIRNIIHNDIIMQAPDFIQSSGMGRRHT
jgi:hypothetical protein